jgi:hypothetical protein
MFTLFFLQKTQSECDNMFHDMESYTKILHLSEFPSMVMFSCSSSGNSLVELVAVELGHIYRNTSHCGSVQAEWLIGRVEV